MKRFRFKLQAVHDLRETKRSEAERHLVAAEAALCSARAQVEEAARARESAAMTYASEYARGALDSQQAAWRADHLIRLAQREADARLRLVAFERERDAKREALIELTRNAETTAKLRERHSALHRAELERSEQNALDEIAALNAARRLTIR